MKSRIIAALLILAVSPAIVGSTPINDLRSFGKGSWQTIRDAHAGKPTVVHFWGVTCGPCRVEMPSWGRFLKERPNLDLVMINSDLVPNEPASVTKMLASTGLATAENWIFSDSYVERLRFEIDPSWQGEIPFTVLIDRDGKAVTITGSVELEELAAWLDGRLTTIGNQ